MELAQGKALTLVGVRCHERLCEALGSEVGACACSPSRYGYPDLEYQPIEEFVEGFR